MKKDHPGSSMRIIGLGNLMRGDDAVGLLAARRLRQSLGDRAEVIEAGMAGVDIVELMRGASVAIMIDAAQSGQCPGTIHRLDASTEPIAVQMHSPSSHALGLSEALELARALGVLPKTVIVFGIEVGDTEAGQPLSPQVAKALDEVVSLVIQECDACHA